MKLQSFFGLALASLAFAPIQISAATVASNPTQELAKGGTVKPTMLIAQQSRTYRMRFAPGQVGATVKNSVIRGTRDTYIVAAKARQTMRVNISSLEKNAVFDIKGPNGRTITQERTSWSGTLPTTGDYEVVVGGTRGNASYTLRVSAY